ncbi:MAG TPA: c-type cytochrome [Pirellulaceae bacterium]|nr:c-type cytochrome [Pirellulaceae bacterium]
MAHSSRLSWLLLLLIAASCTAAPLAAQTNVARPTPFGPTAVGDRLAYLDEPCDPYAVGLGFPKLLTPQWVGDPQVEAVVVLAIDDMRDPEKYESYLRPILDRLAAIDGRAPVSVMTNDVDPEHPRLKQWLAEGLSIDVHTIDHPCPCLQGGDFAQAKGTYDRCVDRMASIPGNLPTTFRMPCCDSLNTPSPRFYAEIFAGRTPGGRFLTGDSSVFNVMTGDDPELPGDLLVDDDGQPRFRKYLPFPSFVNTIRNYPYPYVIGRLGWQFPCAVPSDWEAQHLHQPNNPRTVDDLKCLLDLTVTKRGMMNVVFHPHGWIRAEQIVELIDHAVARHGPKVRFLTFREVQQRIDANLLAGRPLRRADGSYSGTRLLDLDGDGLLDVVTSGPDSLTRLWDPTTAAFIDRPTPFLTEPSETGSDRQGLAGADRARFGILTAEGSVEVLAPAAEAPHAITLFRFTDGGWIRSPLPTPWTPTVSFDAAATAGLRGRFKDLDRDGICEWLVDANDGTRGWSLVDGAWQPLPAPLLPDGWTLFPIDATATDHGLRFRDVDGDGRDDLIGSDERRYGAWPFVSLERPFGEPWFAGVRSGSEQAIPMIARDGTNNGAWFHSGTLWVQNEQTNRLPDLVERMPLESLLDRVDPERRDRGMPLPRTPEQALATMRVAGEFDVRLAAAEPLTEDPVAFDWGPDGRLWVVEMADYPRGIDDRGTVGGRVRVLEDLDGDGVYDRSTLFLDSLPYPNGIKVWGEGVFVSTAPDLIFAVDRDGDGRADERTTILTGFDPGNQQHRFNGLRYGLDHRLYLANGDSGGTIGRPGETRTIDIGGRDLWFVPHADGETPRAVDFGTTSGMTQFGRDRNDWGDWFGGNNANPMWHYVIEERYLARNPHVPSAAPRQDVSVEPGASPVYPLSATLARFNDLHMANRFTSACSPMIYRDRATIDGLWGDAFVCEPVHNLVHRERMERMGASWTSARPADQQRSEFLATDDSWFRPVMARTGPDGAIWIADMYRLVIEHPEWIAPERQRELNLRSGADRGRIWRIVPRGHERPIPRLDRLSIDECVAQLESPNGVVRDLVQERLIRERRVEATEPLRRLLQSGREPTTRLHALATLEGLDRLTTRDLIAALDETHPEVRRSVVSLTERRIEAHPAADSSEARDRIELLTRLERLADAETDRAVLVRLAVTLGATDDAVAVRALVRLMSMAPDDRRLSAAIASSLRADTIERIIEGVLIDGGEPIPGDRADALMATAAGWASSEAFDRWLTEWLRGWSLDSALPLDRQRGWQAIAAWRDAGREPTAVASQWLAANLTRARDELDREVVGLMTGPRENALRILSATRPLTVEDGVRIADCLTARRPIRLRDAALGTLAAIDLPEAADAILARWSELNPETRRQVVDRLLSRGVWAERLIDGVLAGRVSRHDLGPSAFDRLVRAAGAERAERMARLAGGLPDPDRVALVERYAAALPVDRDPVRGRERFAQHCATCHRLDAIGTPLGPDLAALSNRSDEFLLAAILDPNRAIEDKYLQYLAQTDDGLQLAGVIVTETEATVTLGTVEGKEVTLQRERLEAFEATGRSLMPDGFEAQLDPAALADVLAFLQSNVTPPKRFAGNDPQLVTADGLGGVTLAAKHARIYGPSLVFEATHENLGWWIDPKDHAIWEFEIDQPGRYAVLFEYASDDGSAGGRWSVEAGGQSLEGTVTGTGSWDDYVRKPVGSIRLRAGRQTLILRPLGSLDSALIDLRAIRLEPE